MPDKKTVTGEVTERDEQLDEANPRVKCEINGEWFAFWPLWGEREVNAPQVGDCISADYTEKPSKDGQFVNRGVKAGDWAIQRETEQPQPKLAQGGPPKANPRVNPSPVPTKPVGKSAKDISIENQVCLKAASVVVGSLGVADVESAKLALDMIFDHNKKLLSGWTVEDVIAAVGGEGVEETEPGPPQEADIGKLEGLKAQAQAKAEEISKPWKDVIGFFNANCSKMTPIQGWSKVVEALVTKPDTVVPF